MRGALHRVWMIIFLVGLAGCSSRSVNTELTRCVYPDSPRTAAPSFLCGEQIAGYPVSAVRSAESTELSVSETIQGLLSDQLIQWSKDWSEQWFDEEADRLRAEEYLITWLKDHARVVRSRVSPRNHIWILIGVPKSLLELKAVTESAIAE